MWCGADLLSEWPAEARFIAHLSRCLAYIYQSALPHATQVPQVRSSTATNSKLPSRQAGVPSHPLPHVACLLPNLRPQFNWATITPYTVPMGLLCNPHVLSVS